MGGIGASDGAGEVRGDGGIDSDGSSDGVRMRERYSGHEESFCWESIVYGWILTERCLLRV